MRCSCELVVWRNRAALLESVLLSGTKRWNDCVLKDSHISVGTGACGTLVRKRLIPTEGGM